MTDNTITIMLEPINLIHCNECRFYSGVYCKLRTEDEWHQLITEPDDYCIHGERKDHGKVSND